MTQKMLPDRWLANISNQQQHSLHYTWERGGEARGVGSEADQGAQDSNSGESHSGARAHAVGLGWDGLVLVAEASE